MKRTLLCGITLFLGSYLFAQSVADLPYSYGFETADLDQWVVTNEGSGNVWERTQASSSTPDPSEGLYYMNYSFNSAAAANTYLYSRGLNLKAGRTITLQFDYQGIDFFFPEKMEVRIGTEATVAGQTTQLWVNEDITNYPYETASIDFTVPVDGVYYISFRAFSEPDQFYLSLDNIKVFEEILAVDNSRTNSAKFYPNPATNVLNISHASKITSVDVYDLTGKRVLAQKTNSASIQLNVSQLKPGMYIVKTSVDGKTTSFKVIKK